MLASRLGEFGDNLHWVPARDNQQADMNMSDGAVANHYFVID